MASVTEKIDVNVPVRTAYNQWTQFEEFPRFMEGVKEVRQLDDEHLNWTVEVGGRTKEWRAEITEQNPDERVAWRSEAGADNSGVVTFHRLGDEQCRVTVQIDGRARGHRRERRRCAGHARTARQGRSRTVQGLHRGAWLGVGGVARRGGSGSHSLSPSQVG